MIELELLGACENCHDFEAKSEYIGDIQSGFNVEPCYQVTCVNMNKCRALLEHLEKEVEKNGN